MIKNLLGDTLKYGLGNVIVKFFSILVVPIIAKNFPPDIFGEINIVTTFVALFSGIAVLGFDSAAGYYYFHGEEKLKKDYLGTALATRIFTALVFFLLFAVFAKLLAGTNILLKNQERYFLIVLGAALLPFDNCMSFFVDLSRFLIKPIIYNIANISKIALYYIFIVIFLFTNLTVEKVFISMIFSSVIPSLFLFFFYRKHLKLNINVYCLKKLLKYGLPLMPTAVMFWFVNSVSRFILNSYAGLEETGIYSMMITISGIFLLITGSILAAWPPYAMNIAKRGDAQIIYARIFQLLLVFLVPLAFLFWSVSEIVILIFSKPIYLIGGKVIILILLQHILYLLYQCGAIGLTLKEKTIYITIGYSISGIITILTSLVLCKYFGILGAALSVFFGYLLAIVYILIKSHQFYPVPYDRKFLFIYSMVLLIVVFLSLFLVNSNLVYNFIIRFAIGVMFLFVPFVIKIVSISDIKSAFINRGTIT